MRQRLRSQPPRYADITLVHQTHRSVDNGLGQQLWNCDRVELRGVWRLCRASTGLARENKGITVSVAVSLDGADTRHCAAVRVGSRHFKLLSLLGSSVFSVPRF